jgi:hypothetical protein
VGEPQQPEADSLFECEWDNLRAAHSWAVATGRLEAADVLVAATGPHALCRVTHEHGDWARRTLDLHTIDRPAGPTTHGWAAFWAYSGGEIDHAIELADRGIAVAPEPDHPDTLVCWCSLMVANLAAGHHSGARDAARRGGRAAAGSRDRFAVAWTQWNIVTTAFDADIEYVKDTVARLTSLSEQIGAPSLLARAAYFEGRVKLWLQEPRDADGALASYGRGVEWARIARDISHENWNLTGIVFAKAELRSADMDDIFLYTLNRLHDTRDWIGIWITLIPLVSWLEATGNVEATTVICGHLDAHRTPWRGLDGRLNELRAPREHPQADQLRARGAAMDRDQLVAFALEQLTGPANQ